MGIFACRSVFQHQSKHKSKTYIQWGASESDDYVTAAAGKKTR